MVGCFFAIAANISEAFGYESWIEEFGLADSNAKQKYLASIYWAAVTISTVGYGDIVPTNAIEMTVGLGLIFSGVAFYSYIVSKLSNLFSTVKENKIITREEIVTDFAGKQRFTEHLTKRVQYFFKTNRTDNSSLIF